MIPASVTKGKAIILGNHIVCDAHEDGRDVRVVTHAHHDHIYGLRESLVKCKVVYATPITRDVLHVLYGRGSEGVMPLRYKEPVMVNDEIMVLYPAGHIPGSAQVLVEDSEGRRALYTGDFRLPGATVVETDVLVIEATYGHPKCVRPPTEEVYNALIKLVSDEVERKPVHVYGFYGKVQEVMEVMRRSGVRAPFLAKGKMYDLTMACIKHGVDARDVINADTREGVELLKRRGGYVFFKHASKVSEGVEGLKIHLTGWEFGATHRKVAKNLYRVSLSSHSDFNNLLAYVEGSKPRFVVVDNSRDGFGKVFAREVKRRLKIEAVALP
ncbi:MAG: MBL fold metallo-hydrolase [Candidatus Nezhaarchaeota archaeon]|nr:MBL fold metallo-hydrolase [Candidatus Nezhaarchaeota archaeon]MCX8141528.1 MBL fold metallo-hydrolase [Candidatus Nezhaarchaeota archaeon]MDW8049795.1 MBL fold metallo-hydrolase [Nitrososphaerota archaeon]